MSILGSSPGNSRPAFPLAKDGSIVRIPLSTAEVPSDIKNATPDAAALFTICRTRFKQPGWEAVILTVYCAAPKCRSAAFIDDCNCWPQYRSIRCLTRSRSAGLVNRTVPMGIGSDRGLPIQRERSPGAASGSGEFTRDVWYFFGGLESFGPEGRCRSPHGEAIRLLVWWGALCYWVRRTSPTPRCLFFSDSRSTNWL